MTDARERPGDQDDQLVGRVVVWSLVALVAILALNGAIFAAARWIPSTAKANFFQDAVVELRSAPSPGDGEGWAREGYLVFDEGWAAYRMSSSRQGWPSPDVAVLKSHDGRWYVSEHAFGDVVVRVLPSEGRPANLEAYLARFPRHGWHAIEDPR